LSFDELERRTLLSTFSVLNTDDSGIGSLRQAILNANATPGINTIAFSIGTGIQTIMPASALPTITNPAIIDGSTQPGFSGTPIIVLDGSQAGANVNGLTITAGTSIVRDLVIDHFSGNGIELDTVGNNQIVGNYIGADVTGTQGAGNGAIGIAVTSGTLNTIGGTAAGTGNVIAWNSQAGVAVLGSLTQAAILGNSIHANSMLGIDLNNDGVTNNTSSENAVQPNDGMNFPVFTSAALSGSILTVAGYVGTAPGQATFAGARVEIFQSDNDASGHGQGSTFLGSLTADASGNFNGLLTLSGLNTGDTITATATDSAGNTSEFSANVATASDNGLLGSTTSETTSLNPAVYGQAVTITATVSSLLGLLQSGTVTFMDGGTNLGTVSLGGGTASLTTSALTAGTHNITAYYSGNGVYGPSASGVLTQIITPATLTVTANDASKMYGQSNPLFTNTITGFVNGDNASVVSGSAGLTTTATVASGIGTYSITAAQGSLSAANYTFTFASGTLTVTRATLTVTDNQSKVYGAAVPTLAATVSGFVNGDGPVVVSGAPTLSTTATSGSPVGTYAISVIAGTLSAANYAFTYVNGTMTVTPATLTVTANNASKAYAQSNPSFSNTITGFVNGDNAGVVSGSASLSTTATASSGVGTYVIAAAQGSLGAANYTFAFINGTITITPATLTVTANNASKIYGQANPAFTDTITGYVNGDDASVVSGSASLTTTATVASGVGTYAITATQESLSAANYTFTFMGGTLTVTRATLTVTDNQSKVYGAAPPTLVASYSGFVNGDGPAVTSGAPALSTTATQSSSVGTYAITVAPGTLSSANYTFACVNGLLTVTPAMLTVTAHNASKVYGQANPTFSASITGFVNGDSASVVSGSASLTTTATAASGVGTYAIVAAQGSLSATNYTFAFVNGTLTITPAMLTVTDNQSMVYGNAVPTLAASYSGFLNGDGPAVLSGAVALSTTATSADDVGNYPITVGPGTLSAANYVFVCVNGTMTITPATLTVSADNITTIYGQPSRPALSYTISGFVNGDDASILHGKPDLDTPAKPFSDVGTYPITTSPGNLSAPADYNLAFVDGTVTIAPAPLTVTANQSMVYGAAMPTLSATYVGFVNGDGPGVLSGAPTLSTTATAGSSVGTYPVAVGIGTLSATNYTISAVDGTFTVTPATLTVTAASASKIYGQPNPTLSDTITGFVNGDTSSVLSGSGTLTTAATASSGAGTYAITPGLGTLSAANYTFAFVNGTLTITPAMLTVTANNASKVYGQANPAFSATYIGFVNGDNASVLSGSALLTTTATAGSGVGTYAITAARGSLSAANYTFTFVGGTLTVTPAQLTLTDNQSKVYGAALPTLSASYSGFVNGDGPAALSGGPTLSTAATSSSSIGTYTITVGTGTLSAANYTITSVDGTLTVIPATLLVTANNASKVFGQANPAFTDTITGFVNGDTSSVVSGSASLTTTATASSGVGTYSIKAAQGSLSAANYVFAFVNGTLAVTPAPLTVTANNASKVYGQANPAFSDTITGFVNGDTSSVVTGSAGLTTTATASNGVGTYTITAALGTLSAANYTFAFVNGTLTITPATLTVTANNASKVYGQANPAFTDTITSFVNGDASSVVSGSASLTTTATASSGVGTYTITAALGTLSAANYTFAFATGTLTITPATLTVTANNASKVYGQANPAFTDTITGFVNGDTASVVSGSAGLTTTATVASGVGMYSIKAAQGSLSAANYVFTFVNGTLAVTPATLTVTASNASKVYGQANPAFSDTLTGFVNGDTSIVISGSASLTTTATTSSGVGTYTITAAVGTLSAANYTFAFTTSTLTITPATLTVTANNASKVYGQANPAFTATITGLVNGDTASVVSGSATLTTTATVASGVGTYTITAGLGALSAANYTFAFAKGTLTITPATLTVTANNASKVYGQANPAFSDTITGFVNGDTASAVNGSATMTTTATASSGVGTYTITASLGTLKAASYAFAFASGTLAITPATLTVRAADASKVYGQTNPGFSYTLGGLVNGDLGTVVIGSPSLTTTATTSSGVGSYLIMAALGSLSASNYSFVFLNGTLAVTPAALTVTADNTSRIYGQSNPLFTATYGGFVNGDTAAALGGALSFSTTATTASPVGSCAVAPGGLTSSNYSIAFVAGTLSITPASLTVTANDAAKVYGQANPAFSDTITGFVNGDTAAVVSGASDLTTTATASSGVGSYTIAVAQGTLSAANYTFAVVNSMLTVAPAPLTVTAINASKVQGQPNPVFTASYGGFVNGDSAASLGGALTFTTPATDSSPVGTYVVSPSGLNSTNYSITFVSGTLTVTSPLASATSTIIVSSGDPSVYGQAVTFTATVSAATGTPTGVISFLDSGNLLGTASLAGGTAALTIASLTAGSHTIIASYSGDVSYAASSSAPLPQSVTPAPLTVTANDASKVYGQANPAFGATYHGFVNGDNAGALAGTLAFSTAATAASPVGAYAITPGGLYSANYAITFARGTLSIIPATLTVTANDASKVYGKANPAFTDSISGFVNGDNASVVSGAARLTSTATAASSVGTYTIIAGQGTLRAANYNFVLVRGTLTVTPAVLTVTADDAGKVYGEANPALTVGFTGFANGDTPSVVLGSADLMATATESTGVGTYTISATAGSLSAANYTFVLENGTLTIMPATLVVTADDASREFGQPNPALTATMTGFVNGDDGSVVSGNANLSTTATPASDAGTYQIIAEQGSLSASNYVFAFVDGKLTITGDSGSTDTSPPPTTLPPPVTASQPPPAKIGPPPSGLPSSPTLTLATPPPAPIAVVADSAAGSAARASTPAASAAVVLASTHSVGAQEAGPHNPVSAVAVMPTPPTPESSSAIVPAPPAPMTAAPVPPTAPRSVPAPAGSAPPAVVAPPSTAPVLETSALFAALDEFQPAIEDQPASTAVSVGVVTGVLASAGYLIMSARASYWLLTLLMARPLIWKRFDPLEVLFAWEQEKKRQSANGATDESLQSLVVKK
jgi:hypothetical protein